MSNMLKVHEDLYEVLYATDIVKDFKLSEREINKIVTEAAKDEKVYDAVQNHIECPSDEDKTDEYNNIVNAKLIRITKDLYLPDKSI